MRKNVNFISKWLTIHCKQKYLGQRYEMDEVVGRVVQLLLGTAVQNNASSIIFGEPVEPHPALDRSLMTPPESDPELESLTKEADLLLGSTAKGPFCDSPSSMVPIWMKINGNWRQSEAIPLNLLHLVILHIEGLCETEPEGIEVDYGNGNVIQIALSIRCGSNFNYVIDWKPM